MAGPERPVTFTTATASTPTSGSFGNREWANGYGHAYNSRTGQLAAGQQARIQNAFNDPRTADAPNWFGRESDFYRGQSRNYFAGRHPIHRRPASDESAHHAVPTELGWTGLPIMGLHTVRGIITVHRDCKAMVTITPRPVIRLPMVLVEAFFMAWVISFVEVGTGVFTEAAGAGAEADAVVAAEVGVAAREEVVTDEMAGEQCQCSVKRQPYETIGGYLADSGDRLALCAGCSSLEPSQKQRAALANSPWTEKCLLPSDQNPSEAGIDTWPESVFNQ